MPRTSPTDRPPRLSDKEAVVLDLLRHGRARYGLELVAASRGRLKRGTVYVTLGRMEDKGFVTSRLDDEPSSTGGLPRRLYEPTAVGLRVWRAWTALVQALRPEAAR